MPFSKNCVSWNKGKQLSEETRRKIGEANKIKMKENKNALGNIPWNKGKYLSEEHKRKIGLASIGNKHCVGKYPSEETKEKMSESKKGKKNPFYGRHFSEETKKKMSESHKGQSPPNKGGHPTEETMKKIIEHLKNIKRKYPSKPQLKLFEVIQKQYPSNNVVLECSIKTSLGSKFLVDVAIPELKLGFEYDEPYWHQNKEKDSQRHSLIESEGWKLKHFQNISEFSGV